MWTPFQVTKPLPSPPIGAMNSSMAGNVVGGSLIFNLVIRKTQHSVTMGRVAGLCFAKPTQNLKNSNPEPAKSSPPKAPSTKPNHPPATHSPIVGTGRTVLLSKCVSLKRSRIMENTTDTRNLKEMAERERKREKIGEKGEKGEGKRLNKDRLSSRGRGVALYATYIVTGKQIGRAHV